MEPNEPHRLSFVTFIVILTFCAMITVPAWSQSSSSDQQQGTATGAGMGALSAVSTILYFPFKGAFALGGGIVGGLAYLFSGMSEQAAKNIWIPSMYGTYVITPEHLNGERPVRFFGVAAETERAVADTAPMENLSQEPVQ
ncbi:MAG TPA: hypothetical protein VLA47_07325 [Nitrospira sp.]|nr:hypothetical protein [Nitrospira sp.]